MPTLTGRYKFEARIVGVVLYVEEGSGGGVRWRKARAADLKHPEIEKAVSDGWRFPDERKGILYVGNDGVGRRDTWHQEWCGCTPMQRQA